MSKAKTINISFIQAECDWYEKKVKELMDLVDANSPFSNIPDRTETETNAKGVPIVKLIAKREETIKVMKDILKDLPTMFQALKELRAEKAAAKIETRGDKSIPGMMSKFIEERG